MQDEDTQPQEETKGINSMDSEPTPVVSEPITEELIPSVPEEIKEPESPEEEKPQEPEAIKPAPKIWDLSETSSPPAQEAQIVEEKPQEPEETDPDKMKPYTVRTEETGDKVYAIVKQKRYWVRNPETLAKLGFHLGGEKKIPFSDLLKAPEGTPVDLTVPGAVPDWEKPESEQGQEGKKPDTPYNVWS